LGQMHKFQYGKFDRSMTAHYEWRSSELERSMKNLVASKFSSRRARFPPIDVLYELLSNDCLTAMIPIQPLLSVLICRFASEQFAQSTKYGLRLDAFIVAKSN